MAFCIFSGDSFRSLAIEGKDVFRIVESSICIKIAVARISGRIFLIDVVEELISDILYQLESLNNVYPFIKLQLI
jgi:hypothetical protein